MIDQVDQIVSRIAEKFSLSPSELRIMRKPGVSVLAVPQEKVPALRQVQQMSMLGAIIQCESGVALISAGSDDLLLLACKQLASKNRRP